MSKEAVINDMIDSLLYEANQYGLTGEDIAVDDVNDLDDIFNDGGEVRCEKFVDLAYDYAIECGASFESDKFFNISWECIEGALTILKDKYRKG